MHTDSTISGFSLNAKVTTCPEKRVAARRPGGASKKAFTQMGTGKKHELEE